MREGCLIVPQADNAGQSLQRLKLTVEKSLSKQFGGCTTTCGKGHWVNGRGELVSEPVWQITVAYEPSADNDRKLESIARYVGTEGNQDAVYVRFASGDAQIIDTVPQALPKAA